MPDLPLSVLDEFFGPARIKGEDNVELPRRLVNKFTGKVTITDNPTSVPPQTEFAIGCGSDFVDETNPTTTVWADGDCTDGTAAAPSTAVRARRREITTTTATANQVLEDGGTFGGVDLTLSPDSITHVSITAFLKKNGAAAGGLITICQAFMRNGSGAPVLIPGDNDLPHYALTGSTLDGTTANLHVNGNKVEFRVSPESADTLHWRIIRVQSEGIY